MRKLSLLAALTLVPLPALAETMALTPLLGTKGVDEKRVEDIFDLMSSELEFMDGIDEVIEVNPAPSMLTTSCLASTRCLSSVTGTADGDALIAGSIDRLGQELVLDLVYYQKTSNRVVRRQTFTMSSEPTEMIEQMTPILVELLTGVSPTKEREAAAMADANFDDEDDFAFGDSSSAPRAVDIPITPAPVPDEPEEEAEVTFSFGSTASSVTFDEDAEPDEAFEDSPDIEEEDDESLADGGYDYEEEEDEADEYASASRSSSSRSSSSRSSSSRSTSSRDSSSRSSSYSSSSYSKKPKSSGKEEMPRVQIQTRFGGQTFSAFKFWNAGLDLSVRTVGGLYVNVGVDASWVNHEMVTADYNNRGNQAVCKPGDRDGVYVCTDTFVPFHAGLLYQFNVGKFRPYIGADVIVVQNYAFGVAPQPRQFYFSAGGRARLGFNFMMSKNVGITADLGLGAWSSAYWPEINDQLTPTGFLFTGTGGLVFAF